MAELVGLNGSPSSELRKLPEDVESDLDSILEWLLEHAAEMPAKASLYERKNGEWSHLHSFESLEEVTHDSIREAFGGGRYQVRFVRRAGGHLRAVTVPVSGPKQAREGEEPAASSSSPESSRLDRLERALERLLEKVADAPKQPSADLVGLAMAMAQAQAPLLAALAQSKAPAGPDMAAFGELLIRAIELGREGGGGGGDGYGSVIRDFGGPLLNILSQATTPGGGGAPPALTPAAPATPAPSSSNAPTPGAPGWLTQLGPLMPRLLQLAQLHGDVDYWAEKVLEGADDASLAWIRAELERRPEFEAEFYAWVPAAVPHKEWFDGFWEALADELAPDDGLDGEELGG